MAKVIRAKNDVYNQLTATQVLLTNLPTDSAQLSDTKYLSDFLHKNVNKGIEVQKVEKISSLESQSLRAKTAYIKVTLASKSQAQMVKKKLAKTWVGDSLLKVKTQADAKKEHFNNRTVLIQNIPKYLNTDKVLEVFGKDAGTIVGIELPRQNTKLKNLRYAIEE